MTQNSSQNEQNQSGTRKSEAEPNSPQSPVVELTAGAPAPISANNNLLWVDPAKDDDFLKNRISFGSVLLAEDITRYAEQYNLLIDKSDFIQGSKFGAKLKGASYTMSPDPDEGWMFEINAKGEVCQVRLKKDQDSDGEYYIVPKNALVYIKLRQKLRVPYYFIGRHNLKIRYVYKGLLLGTGPQVDPGFVGNLFIPLHNFTTKDVNIHINDSFVSIDFVRTTPLFSESESNIPENRDDLYARFKNKHLLDQEKLERRITLNAYLENTKPISQMRQFYSDFSNLEAEVKGVVKGNESSIASLKSGFETLKNDLEKRQTKHENGINGKFFKYKAFEYAAVLGLFFLAINLYRLYERDVETASLDYNRALISTNLVSMTQELTQMTNQDDEFKKTMNVRLDESNAQNALMQANLKNEISNLDGNMQMLQKSMQKLMDTSSQGENTNKLSKP